MQVPKSGFVAFLWRTDTEASVELVFAARQKSKVAAGTRHLAREAVAQTFEVLQDALISDTVSEVCEEYLSLYLTMSQKSWEVCLASVGDVLGGVPSTVKHSAELLRGLVSLWNLNGPSGACLKDLDAVKMLWPCLDPAT